MNLFRKCMHRIVDRLTKKKTKQQVIRKINREDDQAYSEVGEDTEGYFHELLFKPFQILWQIILTLSIILSCTLTQITFVLDGTLREFNLKPEVGVNVWIAMLLIGTEAIYIYNLFLLTLHKLIKGVQVTRPYQPVTTKRLVVAYMTIITSLISIYLYMSEIKYSTLSYVRPFILLRLIIVVLVYAHMINSTYLSEFVIVCVIITLMSLLVTLFSTFLICYWLMESRAYNLTAEETLMKTMPMLHVKAFKSWPLKSELDLLYWSYFVAANSLFGRSFVAVQSHTIDFSIVHAIFESFIFINLMFLIAIFTTVLLYKWLKQVQFNELVENLKNKMGDMELHKVTYNSVLTHYNFLAGVHEMFSRNRILLVLPDALYRDCCLDIHWMALKHSHLFRKVEINFAAALALEMETELHYDGDILYQKGMVRESMYYIHSGVVQIMSNYDDSSPIVSLFPGTCFGESTLVISYPVKNRIICAKYCELKVLTKEKLHMVGKIYPNELRLLKERILDRYSKGRLQSAMKRLSLRWNINDKIGVHEDGSLRRIKEIARAIDKASFSKCYDSFEQEDKFNEIFDRARMKERLIGSCADYLDSYVISEYSNNKEEVTFIRSTFPVVLHPNTPFIKMWNLIVLICVIFMTFFIPLEAGLGFSINDVLHMVISFVQIIFILDVIFQCTFAIATQEKIIDTVRDIFYYRLNTMEYKLDVLGSLPFNYLAILTEGDISYTTWALLKLNYTLRAWRLFTLCNEKIKNSLTFREPLVLFFFTFYFLCFICYWSMVFSILSCYDSICDPNAMWLESGKTEEANPDVLFITFKTAFDVLLLTLGLGSGYVSPYKFSEYLVYTLMSGMFLLCFAYSVAFACAVVIHRKRSNPVIAEWTGPILNLMNKFNLSSELQYRLNRQVRLVHNTVNTNWFRGSAHVPGLSPHLRIELKMAKWINFILKVPLFANTERKFLCQIADLTLSRLFPPDEIVTYSGMLADHMYIIMKGYCQIVGPKSHKIEAIKGPGWSFGVFECLLNIPSIKTIKTMTLCELLVINRVTLIKTIKTFPNHYVDIKKTIQKCEALRNLPTVEGVIHTYSYKKENSKLFHHFGYSMAAGSEAENEFLRPFGKYTFLSYILFHSVILPSSRLIWILEIMRSCFAFLSCICFPAKVLIWHRSNYLAILFQFLDVTAYIDIYIRLHVAYYNEIGILITHPLMTATHYIKTSFILDLLGCIPYETIIAAPESHSNLKYWLTYNRIIQIHRTIGLLRHIYSRQLLPSTPFVILKQFVVIVVMINVFTSISLNMSCEISRKFQIFENGSEWIGIRCPNLEYNEAAFGNSIVTPTTIYIYFLFYTTALFTQFNVLSIGRTMNIEFYMFFICMVGFTTILYIISEIISLTYMKKVGLVYQHKVKMVNNFFVSANLSRALQDEFSLFYNTFWEKYHGINPKEAICIANRALQDDVLYHVYGKCLKEYTIFAKSTVTFFRTLILHFDTEVFHKGSIVLMEGFVHNKVYLLYEGYVTVIASQRPVMTLKKGAFFGNLYETDYCQQSLCIKATTVVEVLVLQTKIFYYVLNAYPQYKEQFVNCLKSQSNRGFCIINSFDSDEITNEESYDQSTGAKSINKSNWLVSQKYQLFKAIVALLSSLSTMYTIAMQEFTVIAVIVLFILDLLSFMIVIGNLYTPFQDDLGEYESDLKKIRIHYRKGLFGFWFDIGTLFPLECFWVLFPNQHYSYLRLRFNRILRYIILWRILEEYKSKISRKQITKNLISLLINFYYCIYVSSSVWLFLNVLYNTTNSDSNSYLRISQFIQVFSVILGDFNHYPREVPIRYSSATVVIIRVLMMILTVFVMAIMVGNMVYYVETYYYGILNYIEEKRTILSMFKVQSISKYLYKCVDTYLHLIWEFSEGCQRPELIFKAPASLRIKGMKSVYEKHIVDHYIFGKCEQSFTDQVMFNINRLIIFPGNVIVRKGTKDKTMYFVNKGIVKVYGIDEDQSELYLGTLVENDYFGTRQGLCEGVAHAYTFKTHTVVTILRLKFEAWSYLLSHFPLEKIRVYKILQEQGDKHPFN